MQVKTKKNGKDSYLLLKENESITILADSELKSCIHIMCKNRKLYINFDENFQKKIATKKE